MRVKVFNKFTSVSLHLSLRFSEFLLYGGAYSLHLWVYEKVQNEQNSCYPIQN